MNKQQLASKIWESANKMRSKIEANEYKDYILGFIFYKFLSETEVARLKARDLFTEVAFLSPVRFIDHNNDVVASVQFTADLTKLKDGSNEDFTHIATEE